MATLRLENVQPGQLLRKSVRDLSGRLLLGQGEPIQLKHIRIFRTWGVTEVEVEDGDANDPGGISNDFFTNHPALWDSAQTLARDFFLHNDLAHPLIREMHTHFLQRVCRRLESVE